MVLFWAKIYSWVCRWRNLKSFFFLSKCIRRSTSVDEVKGFFWFVLAVQGWRWGPPVPLASAVCWILSSTLSVPGFVFNIVQLQEGVQSIAAASFIGSGNKPEEIPSFSLITVLGSYWLGFLTPHLGGNNTDCFRCLRGIRRAQLPGSLSCLLPSQLPLSTGLWKFVEDSHWWLHRMCVFSLEASGELDSLGSSLEFERLSWEEGGFCVWLSLRAVPQSLRPHTPLENHVLSLAQIPWESNLNAGW